MKQIESDAMGYCAKATLSALGNSSEMNAITQVKSQIIMVGINNLSYRDKIARSVTAISADVMNNGIALWDKAKVSGYIYIYANALASFDGHSSDEIFRDIYMWYFAGEYGESKPNI